MHLINSKMPVVRCTSSLYTAKRKKLPIKQNISLIRRQIPIIGIIKCEKTTHLRIDEILDNNDSNVPFP